MEHEEGLTIKPVYSVSSNKSNRSWKEVGKRMSSLIGGNHSSFTKKMEEKKKLQHLKSKQKALNEKVQLENDRKKKQTADNRSKNLSNRKKSRIVTEITNPTKMKKIQRNQLYKSVFPAASDVQNL